MRIRLIVLLILASTPAVAQDAESIAADSVLALPSEWETYYLAFLRPGPSRDLSEEALGDLMNRHIQYQLRLQADGRAVAAGGIAPEPPSDLIGVTMLRAPSLEDARRWAGDDPAVAAGHFTVEVRTWYVPAGRVLLPE
jgi:uncharacterized protein YciI